MSVLVSVVTITYNIIKAGRKKTLCQCIESIHNQTYGNIEHIVIDGASDDGTVEILKEYANKGWLTYFSEPDTGVFDAMNKGIDKASGKYIAFLNSDDFWHDVRGVEESVKYLEKEQADFSYATCYYLGENDRCIGCMKPVLASFYLRQPFNHQTMFTKREKMLEFNKFDDSYKIIADYDFVYRLILNGAKGVYVPLNFTSYRLSGISDVQQYQMQNECLQKLERVFQVYGFNRAEANKAWYLRQVNKNFVSKVKEHLDKLLADEVDTLLSLCPSDMNGYYYNVFYSAVKKIKVIYDVTYLHDFYNEHTIGTALSSIAENILTELLKHSELELYVFCEEDKTHDVADILLKLTHDFPAIKLYKEEKLYQYDIFFSFVRKVPDSIKKSGICCLTYYDIFSSQQHRENLEKKMEIANSYENEVTVKSCETLISEEEDRTQLVQQILEQAKLFSWKNIVDVIVNSFMTVNTNRKKSYYRRFSIKLFGVIPVLTIKNIGTKNKVSLFGMKLFYYE